MARQSEAEISSLTPLVTIRPMLMFTGFLGAGKTTLLRSIISNLANRGHLADVILNDHENALLDRETLKDHAASVTGLTGSCVCCEGADELYSLILKASKSSHSALLVELNGTADPIPLQETFTLLESKFCLRPRWQVCVIDALNFGNRGAYRSLECLQLETASHYFISKDSDLSAEDEILLEQKVKTINPKASRATASSLSDALSQAIENNRKQMMRIPKAAPHSEPSSQFSLTPPKPKLHDRHQISHEFTGCSIILPPRLDSSRVTAWLGQLPSSVVRAKVLVSLRSEPDCRYLFERVGEVISPRPYRVSTVSKVPCSAILIGADLQPEELLELTQQQLHRNCHFPE